MIIVTESHIINTAGICSVGKYKSSEYKETKATFGIVIRWGNGADIGIEHDTVKQRDELFNTLAKMMSETL